MPVEILSTAAQLQEQVVQQIHNKSKYWRYRATVNRRVINYMRPATTVVGVIHKLDRRRVLLTTRST